MINQLLAYPDDSAGSIMTTEYIDLKKDMTGWSRRLTAYAR